MQFLIDVINCALLQSSVNTHKKSENLHRFNKFTVKTLDRDRRTVYRHFAYIYFLIEIYSLYKNNFIIFKTLNSKNTLKFLLQFY